VETLDGRDAPAHTQLRGGIASGAKDRRSTSSAPERSGSGTHPLSHRTSRRWPCTGHRVYL